MPAFEGFEEPVRLPRTDPSEPLSLPEGLSRADPMTIRVLQYTRSAEDSIETVRTLSRTSERVHISARHGEREWLLVRNQFDTRRVSGSLIDHRQQLIIDYEESDLQSEGLASSWSEVMTLGVPLSLLDRMERTGEQSTIGGARAWRYLRGAEPTESSPDELWWNEADHLPLRVVDRGLETETGLEVSIVSREVDASLLEDPKLRYPAYDRIDLADWREERH